MTELEDKFWDTAISEAATGKRPPDQADRILSRLRSPGPAAPDRDSASAQGGMPHVSSPLVPSKVGPAARVFKLRRVLEVAAAAAALIAIGVLTGLIPLGGDKPGDPHGPDPEPHMIAAAPGTEIDKHEHHVELKDGWLLVTTGAPDVHCERSTLTNVDGRVLVHAGSMPSGAQAESVADWLNANGLEQAMIMEAKRWVQGVGLAALVLSGSAMLDGNRIEAQEEETAPAQAIWHQVSTVMDIENLPKTATHIRGVEVDGAHLEFLSQHEQVVAIDFRGCEHLRKEHIESLFKLKKLRLLDLRSAEWDETPNYHAYKHLVHLDELAVDYVPQVESFTGEWPPAGWDAEFQVTLLLAHLAENGVRITLDNLRRVGSEQLAKMVKKIPTIRELNLYDNDDINDADMKVLAEHASIESLNIDRCGGIGELGIAYLAKANRLKSLTTSIMPEGANLYQLTKMTNLESVTFTDLVERARDNPKYDDDLIAVLTGISSLTNLKALGCVVSSGFKPSCFSTLKTMPNLETLTVLCGSSRQRWQDFVSGLQVAHYVPVKTLVLDVFPVLEKLDLEGMHAELSRTIRESMSEFKGSESVESLVLMPGSFPEVEEGGDEPEFVQLLKKFPNLKRISFQLRYREDLDSGRAYAERWLGDYDVVVE